MSYDLPAASMEFREAAAVFLERRSSINPLRRIQFLSERTLHDYGELLGTLGKFFGGMRLDHIHRQHLRGYQVARANGDAMFTHRIRKDVEVPTVAGAAKINRELSTLKQVMVSASAWTPELQAYYDPLQEPDLDIPRALSYDEQERFLAVAASREAWHVVWWYSLVALHTTFSSDELRTLRQGDINLSVGLLSVNRRYGKNQYRRRDVPITDGDCLWALERLAERSVSLVGAGLKMYLFPFAVSRTVRDGMRPMGRTGLRKPFNEVRDAAGVPWFCINGWRHTAITRMAEAGVPIPTIMRRAGHTSPKMTEHYTHISEQAERRALEQMRVQRKPVASAVIPASMPAVRAIFRG